MRAIVLTLPLVLAACEEPVPPPPEKGASEIDEAETSATAAPTPDAQSEVDEQAVATLLYNELRDAIGDPSSLSLEIGTADLDGDGTAEVLAYAMSPMICGTGGCSLYVLRRAGSGYRILDEIGPSQLPVFRLSPGDDGWASLGVTVSGGGMPEQVMEVPHETTGYADNPTVEPARPIPAPDAARIVIARPPLP
ncbi:hypothetical protein WJT74_07390 [Sphingomicrobium sp. XHP0239]|uniref:hypothetical protein n=1 Tax=Sphingomicrobium maritimum TaxID=3133972 RepID=UPI0031CC5EF7